MVFADIPVGVIRKLPVRLDVNQRLPVSQVRVKGAIQEFVSTEPSVIGPALPGDSIEILLVIDVPFSTQPRKAGGTILVESAPALPVVAQFRRDSSGTVTLGNTSANFSVPPDWFVVPSTIGPSAYEVYLPASAEALDAGSLLTPPDVTIYLEPNDGGLSARDFIDAYAGGWYAVYEHLDARLVDGLDALIVSDADSGAPHFPMRAAFIPLFGDVLIVTGEQLDLALFETVIAGLSLNRE